MAKMTALDIIREAAGRLSINNKPYDLSSLSYSVASETTKEAALLLSALNKTGRIVCASFSFPELVVTTSFNPGNVPDDNKNQDLNGFELEYIAPGYDGMVSTYFYDPRKVEGVSPALPYITIDDYMVIRQEAQGQVNNYPNGYIIQGEYVCFAQYLDPEASYYFTYKTKYPFKYLDSQGATLKMTIDKNDDTCLMDDELMILGTVMNFKNYLNRPFQFEMKEYTEYIEHIRTIRGPVEVIKEGSYRNAPTIIPQQQQQQQDRG